MQIFGTLSGSMWKQIVTSARKRDIPMDLTIDEALSVFIRQEGQCAFTGEQLSLVRNADRKGGTASLDRIDSTKGYVLGNVQWVHKVVQKMKNALPDEEFLGWCRKVIQYRG